MRSIVLYSVVAKGHLVFSYKYVSYVLSQEKSIQVNMELCTSLKLQMISESSYDVDTNARVKFKQQ